MITLRQISQEIIRLESGGSPSNDSELSEGYVIRMVRQASNKFLRDVLFANMAQDDRNAPSMFVVRYTVDVNGDNPNKYIDLPEFYQGTNLPFNRGIKGIAPVEDPTNEFIPRNNPAVSRNLECADLDPDQYSYWAEGMRCYFDCDLDFPKVLLKLVVASPDSIDVDDPLPIFAEHQYDIIMLVRQMLANTPIQDKILDNNTSIGVRTTR